MDRLHTAAVHFADAQIERAWAKNEYFPPQRSFNKLDQLWPRNAASLVMRNLLVPFVSACECLLGLLLFSFGLLLFSFGHKRGVSFFGGRP